MSKYPYWKLPGKEKPVFKPIIGVRLAYNKSHKLTTQCIPALVDSGADVCFCSEDIGLWLQVRFKKEKLQEFRAANNTKFKAYKESITLYLGQEERPFPCPFFFSKALNPETPIILDRLGFFDRYNVTFDETNKQIEINHT